MTRRKLFTILLYTVIFCSPTQPAFAASSGHESPAQVGITIVLCATMMKVLSRFNIP